MIQGDPMYLDQVFHHLLQNALRFSAPHTEIAVEVRVSDPHVKLIVRDQGTGVPIEHLTELYQRFSRVHGQTPQHRRGLGIGLYLVREVVERHGGRVEVETAPEQGSQFTITLPHIRAA
jgi:two-component system sensor histidine kinase SenX3